VLAPGRLAYIAIRHQFFVVAFQVNLTQAVQLLKDPLPPTGKPAASDL
jgi:hypothetical protein